MGAELWSRDVKYVLGADGQLDRQPRILVPTSLFGQGRIGDERIGVRVWIRQYYWQDGDSYGVRDKASAERPK